MFQFVASVFLCCLSVCLFLLWIWVLLIICVAMTLLGLGTVLVLIMNPPLFVLYLVLVFVITYRHAPELMEKAQTVVVFHNDECDCCNM
jgi:hypothetical protein